MKKMKFFLMLIAFLLSVNLIFAEMRSSITQYGVTWNFDGQYECGQFVTGDWWVVGPVTITSASPMPSTGRNGSCVNPMPGRQGYDDRQSASYTYSTADRISYPYTLQPDQSLVTGVSKPESETALQNYGVMESQAVLTAVSTAQPANAFRPAYSGTYKRYFTTSQLNMGLIPNVAPPASKPDAANIANYIDMPRIDHINNWTMQWGCSEQNWSNGPEADNDYPCYGRGYSKIISQAALYSMLAVTDKDDIIYSLIQIGIDNYGILKAGGQWSADGGHMNGRKFPMVFAAKLLNDADMLQVGTQYTQKTGPDMQTYYGTTGTPLWGKNCTSPTYFLNGCSGSGAKDCRDPEGLVDGCPDYRDNQTSRTWPGHALAALMMDAKNVWNHNAFFDYVDRWMDGGVSGGGGTGNTFVSDMWNLYRDNLPSGGGTIVDVTGVSVSPASLTLEEGASADLTETVLPDSATYKTVTWSSGNTSIATVDANGLVTAVAEGSCTVTATTTDGGYTANCAVTVNSVGTNVALNQSIIVSAYQDDAGGTYPGTNLIDGDVADASRWSASGFPQWAEIDLGASYDLGRIDVFPYQDRPYQYTIEASTDGTNYSTIVDRSANTESGDVLIDAISTTARYLKITVTGVSGGISSWVSLAELKAYSGSFTPISVTGVSVSPTSLTLDPGTSSDLTETVSPSNATNKAVSWTSANSSIAAVSPTGLVTAVAQGNTTITVTTADGGYTSTCNVTVNAPPSGLMNLPYNNNRFTITDITWPTNVGDAEVCLWNDDKVAAVSINIDDNKEADHAWWMSMAAQYPIFTFTWFINSGNGSANWSAWQAIINAGHEVQAHDNILAGDPYMLSLTGDGEVRHCDINLADDQFYHDTYSDYNDIIEAQLGNQVSTMAYPCGTARVDAIDDVYIACRGVYGVMNTANGVNYLSINSRSAVNDVHDVQVLLDPNETLYNNVYYRGISSNHYHGVDTDTKKQETEAFLAAIYAERDKLWAGGFTEIARYGQERDSHTLTVTNVSSDEISFNLTDQMIDTYFDFPLTVKIRINNSWTDITAIQGGSVIESSIVTYNGNKYALVKAVPDRGLVTVSAGSISIINATGVSVSPTTLSLNAGQTSDLTETVLPSNATDKSVTWSSNNTSVATVSSSGLVTAVSAGSATITVTTNDGGFTANCAVTVNTAPPAGIYYCDPVSGSMSNNGSQGSPWSTLEAVFSAGKTFQAGDVIYLLSGNHGNPVITGVNTANVTITKYASDNPVISSIDFNGAEYWTLQDVKISANGVAFPNQNVPLEHPVYPLSDNSLIHINGGNNIIIDNCDISSIDDNSVWTTADDWNYKAWNGITVGGSSVTVIDCHIKNVNFGCNGGGSNFIFRNNVIENFGGDAMQTGADYAKIENNTFMNCYNTNGNHDDLLQFYAGSGDHYGVEVRGNKFYNYTDPNQPFLGSAQGIAFFDGMHNNFIIENNLIVTDHWHGCTILGATNCTIVNNTVVDPNGSEGIGPCWIQIAAEKVEYGGQASTGNIVSNNLCSALNNDANIGTVENNIVVGFAEYASYFEDYSAFNFHLNGTSPAIDAGTSNNALSTDIEGTTRPQGAGYDVGAYEYNGTFINVTGVTLTPATLSLEIGQNSSLTADVQPSNATNQSVTWSSNNSSVATVNSSGLVTAVSAGNATITVTTVDGGFTSTCVVTISVPSGDYNVALGKPVTVSDEDLPGTPGTNLVNGNTADDSRWSASGFPQWAEIDLGADFDLSSIQLYTYQSRAYQYTVEARPDGGSYSTIVDRSSNTSTTQPITDNVSITARYVKITVSGASGYAGTWVSLTELVVKGSETSTTIAVTDVSVFPTTLTLDEGETTQLTETVNPANATDKSVTWSSNNASVATVDANGLVTAVSAGSATITITTNDGGFTATCVVTVNVPVVPVTGVSVSPTTLTLEEGQTSDLTETVSPANATDKSVTWSSNNTSAATVNSSGLVTAVSAGSATITVTTNDGGFTATCAVIVNVPVVPVTGVSVSPTTLTLDEGQTSDLDETVSPANATDKSVTWSSNNTSVATVNSSGLVTAVSEGSATITVTTNDGSFTTTCNVTVNAISIETNLAFNKPITVSAYQDDSFGYKPGENLVDGDVSDDARWSASGFPQWAEIDLGANYDLNQIDLYPYQDRAYQYIVEAKPDGGSYTTIVDKSANTESADLLVSPVSVTARYVKITVSGLYGSSSTWVSLSELEVWGTVPSAVPVTGISLSASTLDLDAGQTVDLDETVNPIDATDKSVAWSSNNSSVATVDANGLVIAVSSGTATITATTNDGSFTANCMVTVTVPVTGVTLSSSTLDLDAGQTSDLTETVSPVNATDKSVTWSSNNTSVATVSASGLVTAIAEGSATITVTTVDGGFTANCTVTVTVPVTGVTLSSSALNLIEGQTSDLDETVSPANATDKSVTWSSNNTSVAIVDVNGLVSAVATGLATITVTTNDGSFTANCSVTVTEPQIQTLTVAASTDDQEIRSNGGSQWYAYATHRIGGAGSGYDACVVTPFALPTLSAGETVLSANFSVYLNSISNNPGCNIDLYGLPYRATSSVNATGDYYQGSFGGDAGSTTVQDDFATTSTTGGAYVTTSVSGAQDLAAYINAQYAAGAQAGDYIFIRMNPDIADVGNYAYWTFQSANGTEKPTLELEIGSSSNATISSLSNNSLEFNVYPNPVSAGNITITLTGAYDTESNAVIRVLDITGKQVYVENLILNEDNTSVQLNINNMNRGLYFVTITNGEITEQVKLVIQ